MSNSNGTRDCLVFDNRPSTPPEIRKYRRSTNLEPGKRFQHHGLRDDYEKMNLNDKIYGKTDRGSHIGVGDTISYARPSELQRLNDIKAEKIYKNTNKEPLGHSPNKGTILPSKFTQGMCTTIEVLTSIVY